MLKTNTKEHYKMYKSGKQMVNAMLLSALIATGGLALNQTAKADTVANTNAQPTVQTAVNSTVQATSQAVANSAVSSVAPVSQVSSTSNSVNSAAPVAHTDQPASTAVNTFKVAQNSTPVTNVAQSLVQTTQARATNVHTEITSHEGNDRYDVNNLYVGQSPSYDFNGTFTINSNDLVPGKSIYVDDFHFTSSDNNNTRAGWFLDLPVKYNGQTIGQLQYAMNNGGGTGIQLVNLQKINAIGDINLSFSAKGAFSPNYHPSASLFTTLPKTETFWFGSTPDDKTTIQFAKAPTSILIRYVNGDNSNMVNDSNMYVHDAYNIQTVTYDDLQKIVKDHSAPVNVRKNESFGLKYVPTQDTTILRFSLCQAANLAPIDPDTHQPMTDNNGTGLAQYDEGAIHSTQLEANLSLEQLRDRNIDNSILVSRQSDGSYNIWTRYDIMKLTANSIRHYIDNDSFYPLLSGKSKDAITNATIDFYLNSSLDGYSPWMYNDFLAYTADNSISNEMKVTRYDNNLNVIGDNLIAKNEVASSMASGQSAVKLHVINATNGADLKHLIHFVISLIY